MLGLAFSGGKDSLACWYLYRHENPTVFWVNAGKNYPETLSIINQIRNESQFIEVKSDQQKQIEENGFPSDILPVDYTSSGMSVTSEKPIKIQNYLDCCFQNLALPLLNACKERGITHLIRGQRLNESHKSTAVDGTVVDGITFLHPIEHWTKQQVLDYILENRGSIPDHYKIEHSSLDCYDCTAYLAHSKDRVFWMKQKHPHLYAEYSKNMKLVKDACRPIIRELEEADA